MSLSPSLHHPSFHLRAKHIKLNLSFLNGEGHWKPAQIDGMITQHTITCQSRWYVGLTFTFLTWNSHWCTRGVCDGMRRYLRDRVVCVKGVAHLHCHCNFENSSTVFIVNFRLKAPKKSDVFHPPNGIWRCLNLSLMTVMRRVALLPGHCQSNLITLHPHSPEEAH